MSAKTAALILAAGQGKRMKSRLPKVLHPCAEAPLVTHVVKLAVARKCQPIVVVVDPQGGTRVREVLTATFPKAQLRFAVQDVPRGTGDAARSGLEAISGFSGRALVLYGDVPLLTAATVGRLQRALSGKSLAFLTAEVDDPTGYGRVIRNGARATQVIEHQDATRAQREIHEINVGVYLCDAGLLRKTLSGVGSNNAQGEVYLTDVVGLAAQMKGAAAVRVEDIDEVRGVNTRGDLGDAERVMRRRLVSDYQARGVTFRDPDGTFLGSNVQIGRDVVIGVGVQLSGRTKIASGAHIEGPTVIKDAEIGKDAVVHAFSHVEGAKVGRGASVGPFGRLRPGSELGESAKIGNFVEMKKARLGKGAKANHLAYLGDAEIGSNVNIGAGTITCNYDGGPVKHETVIGDGAFTGSNSTLVAPIKIGKGAYVAAGSTVNRDIQKDALAFGRSRQENRDGYARILRQRIGRKGKT